MATTTRHIPLAERQALCGASVSLDGKSARITGWDLEFAHIRTARASAEFAWETVAHIVADRGGRFSS